MFRDEAERKAHDIICIIKYGSPGGRVDGPQLERVADLIRGHSIRPVAPAVRVPVVLLPQRGPVVQLPTRPALTVRIPKL